MPYFWRFKEWFSPGGARGGWFPDGYTQLVKGKDSRRTRIWLWLCGSLGSLGHVSIQVGKGGGEVGGGPLFFFFCEPPEPILLQ